ncbi:MAG TPA: CapA family protein [Melioribacteraceae bacterium]|nr:CapA family protein [Melioribacteraceae bacterium]
MKIKILFLTVNLLLLFIPSDKNFKSDEKKIYADSVSTISLSFVGDIMCHSPQIDYARIGKDSFDFKPVFRYVKNLIEKADLAFGNLETVTAGISEKLTGYPLFNSPDQLLDALKYAGFDFLYTVNNHSLDRGTRGVVRTIEQIEEKGMKNIGSSNSESRSDSLIIIDMKGIKLGLLAYTYGLNGNYLPKSKSFMINLIDTVRIDSDISRLRDKGAELVIVYFHFGDEYSRKPSGFQVETVKKTFQYGADIIIGSHPHVLQRTEFLTKGNGKLKNGFVAYSLGNFISNQRWRYSDAGAILKLEICKNFQRDSIWINNATAIPTWVYKGFTGIKNEFIIVPSDTSFFKVPEFFSSSDKMKMIQSYYDAGEILFRK